VLLVANGAISILIFARYQEFKKEYEGDYFLGGISKRWRVSLVEDLYPE